MALTKTEFDNLIQGLVPNVASDETAVQLAYVKAAQVVRLKDMQTQYDNISKAFASLVSELEARLTSETPATPPPAQS